MLQRGHATVDERKRGDTNHERALESVQRASLPCFATISVPLDLTAFLPCPPASLSLSLSLSLSSRGKQKHMPPKTRSLFLFHSFNRSPSSPSSSSSFLIRPHPSLRTMTMQKRPAEHDLDTPVKKATPSSSSAPKQQTSLLGWAKPKAATTSASVSVSATKEQGSTTVVDAGSSSSSSSSSLLPVLKARPDILKGLSDEMRDLLRLEQDTMDATWLRALQLEFSKPYFVAVITKNKLN